MLAAGAATMVSSNNAHRRTSGVQRHRQRRDRERDPSQGRSFLQRDIQYTKDEDGIATVMGHEIAHAIARHSNERVSQMLLLELGAATLSEAMATQPARTRELAGQAFGLTTNLGVALPFNRARESEADRIGLTLMAKAARPAQGGSSGSASARAEGAGFLSTHPPAKPTADIQRHIPEAMQHLHGRVPREMTFGNRLMGQAAKSACSEMAVKCRCRVYLSFLHDGERDAVRQGPVLVRARETGQSALNSREEAGTISACSDEWSA